METGRFDRGPTGRAFVNPIEQRPGCAASDLSRFSSGIRRAHCSSVKSLVYFSALCDNCLLLSGRIGLVQLCLFYQTGIFKWSLRIAIEYAREPSFVRGAAFL